MPACHESDFQNPLRGGGVLPYISYTSTCHCFGLKKGIHIADFGLESGMVFEGTKGVYERIYHKLLQFQMTKKEREI